jgi:hypothetical protein
MGVSIHAIHGSTPIAGFWMVYFMENEWKSYSNGWLRGTPILGNLHMLPVKKGICQNECRKSTIVPVCSCNRPVWVILTRVFWPCTHWPLSRPEPNGTVRYSLHHNSNTQSRELPRTSLEWLGRTFQANKYVSALRKHVLFVLFRQHVGLLAWRIQKTRRRTKLKLIHCCVAWENGPIAKSFLQLSPAINWDVYCNDVHYIPKQLNIYLSYFLFFVCAEY